jgi:RHS repeat-associated protein
MCGGETCLCRSASLGAGGTSSDPLFETDAAGNVTDEYIFFAGKRTARKKSPSGEIHYYFADHLGSSRVVTSAAGAILDDSDFYPFGGECVITSTTNNPYLFTGKERDGESGLDYFGARYYSSALGRFSSADPLLITRERMRDPQNLNLYSYVRNNPLRHIDPDGLDLIVYEFYSKDLTDEQRKWLEQNKQAIRDAIAAKYKEAGVEKVEFRDGSILSDKQIREAIEKEPTGVSFLNYADKTFAGKNSGGALGATDDIRSVVFLGNVMDSKTDQQTGILRVSEVASHEIGHGQRLESAMWPGFLPNLIRNVIRNNIMDEGQGKPTRRQPIDTKSDINQRVIREINRIGDNTPKPHR